jgi:hypothetical protein
VSRTGQSETRCPRSPGVGPLSSVADRHDWGTPIEQPTSGGFVARWETCWVVRYELWQVPDPPEDEPLCDHFFPEDNTQARRFAMEDGCVMTWSVEAKGSNDAMRAYDEHMAGRPTSRCFVKMAPHIPKTRVSDTERPRQAESGLDPRVSMIAGSGAAIERS